MKMMNNEETMVELHECFNCLRFQSDLSVLNYKKALVLAIKALRKQIPMKPNNIKDILDFSGNYYTSRGNCPMCGRERVSKSDLYCDKCGQKFDWE